MIINYYDRISHTLVILTIYVGGSLTFAVLSRAKFDPWRGISALTGKIANLNLPKPLLLLILKMYISLYKINTEEILIKDLKDYKTINEFFIRKLADGVRTIDEQENSHSICSP